MFIEYLFIIVCLHWTWKALTGKFGELKNLCFKRKNWFQDCWLKLIVHTSDCLKARKLTASCEVSQNELTCYRQQFSMAPFPSPQVHWQDWRSLLYQDITSGHILRHVPELYGKYLPRDCHGNWWYCQLSVLCIPKSWLMRILANSSMFT